MRSYKGFKKNSFILLCAVIMAALFYGCSTAVQDDGITTHRYNDKLIKLSVTSPYVFNYLVSIGEDGILIVDTGLPENSEKIRKKLVTFSDAKIKKVIITHSHGDHIGGLDNLREGAEIYANKIAMTDTYYALPVITRFEDPVVPVEDKATITFNGEEIEMTVPPTGHYKDDMLVYFKESNMWYVGDRLFPDSFPYIDLDNGGSIDELIRSYKESLDLTPDAIFVSSHGRDMTASELQTYSDSLLASIEIVKENMEADKSVAEMVDANILGGWDSYAQGFTDQEAWIQTIVDYYSSDKNKISVVQPMTEILVAEGLDQMILKYQDLKENKSDKYNFDERALNLFGYQLLNRDMLDEALAVLKLNIDAYPNSANTYDSYGEALLAKGDTTQAILLYQKAVEIDSTFQNPKDVLKKLNVDE